MERKVGTISRGIRCPIIREGDDMVSIVVDSVIEASESEGFELRDRDVVAVTDQSFNGFGYFRPQLVGFVYGSVTKKATSIFLHFFNSK